MGFKSREILKTVVSLVPGGQILVRKPGVSNFGVGRLGRPSDGMLFHIGEAANICPNPT